MRLRTALVALALAASLAGCHGPSKELAAKFLKEAAQSLAQEAGKEAIKALASPAPRPTGAPSPWTTLSSGAQRIPAGSTLVLSPIVSDGQSEVRLDVQSPLNVSSAFVLESDVERFDRGEAVTFWGYNESTKRARQEGSLPAGTYALLVECDSPLLGCNVSYALDQRP
ncbi:MAG TPA: hypothetical protein VHH36_09440 [Candidatus Thermoplasmatota archaeon]|nr:hypothetical protein [Candidatus Thermoplasmatota archaeon]